jgi:hypothetical protein
MQYGKYILSASPWWPPWRAFPRPGRLGTQRHLGRRHRDLLVGAFPELPQGQRVPEDLLAGISDAPALSDKGQPLQQRSQRADPRADGCLAHLRPFRYAHETAGR